MDNYKTEGKYLVPSNDTPQNAPSSNGGLLVFLARAGGGFQLFFEGSNLWLRNLGSDGKTWTQWKSL